MNRSRILKQLVLKEVKKILSEGTSTPWGTSDNQYNITRGVVWYSTPSHGGLRVASAYLSDSAKECAHFFGGGYWFEEDVAWTIPVYENYDTWGQEFFKKVGGQVRTKDDLKKDIERWFPDYFDEEHKKMATDKHANLKNINTLKVGDKVYLKGYDKYNPMTIVGVISNTSFTVKANNGGRYKLTKNRIKSSLEKIEPA